MTIDQVLMARSPKGYGDVTGPAYGRGDVQDLGGRVTASGRRVRRAHLFVTEGHQQLLPNGMATIIDLRPISYGPSPPGSGYHHLPAVGSHDIDSDTVAETLAVLTDPWAYPAMLQCTAGRRHAALVIAEVLGVLGIGDQEIAAEACSQRAPKVIRRRYGSFDGYARAIGVGSAAGYVRAALLQ